MGNKYKYIFIILVYRNIKDLEDCIRSIKSNVNSFKIIVVNSYYDEDSKKKCELISFDEHCDFINIENKGYSFGNNRGIEFAVSNYEFDYLVVANPDTEILKFDDKSLNNLVYDIFAPNIITLRGTHQNPMGISHQKIAPKILYKGLKDNRKLYIYSALFLNKLIRCVRIFFNRIRHISIYPIYCAHGSFVILSNKAIFELYPVYDENMFLFAEEGVLASKADKIGLKTCFYPHIYIRHKEDGSMKLSDFSINNMLRDANIYYYETYEK